MIAAELRLDYFSERAAVVRALNLEKMAFIKSKGWREEMVFPNGLFPTAQALKMKKVGVLRGMEVQAVSGEVVRRDIDTDFTMGGTGARYAYINGLDEIWVDAILVGADASATVLHEYVEYRLMRYDGLSYSDAHDIATEHESAFRQSHRGGKRINLRAVDKYLTVRFDSR